MDRRQFLRRSSLALAAPTLLPARVFGQDAPSKQVTLGCIGMGLQGTKVNLRGFLTSPQARVLAVCDCKLSQATKAQAIVEKQQGGPCDVYQDFREVIARDDIDAVVISTPDHWHVPMSLMAIRAGKHVFCEKPTLTITEGQALVAEATRRGTVFQWGIEDRHKEKYWMLAGLARTGAIGAVKKVECGLPHKPLFDIEAPAPAPDDLDWNLWLGPAPEAPYTPTATHPQRWRQCADYSGGSLTDWGAHYCDTAQIGIGMEHAGPVQVTGSTQPQPENSYVSAPSGYDIQLRYANGAVIQASDVTRKNYLRFFGTKGWIGCNGWDGKLVASDRELFRAKNTLADHPDYWPRPDREQQDFVDAIRDPAHTPAYPVASVHRLSTTLHLGHLAARSGKTIHWDPSREAFTQDAAEHEASPIYRRAARDWEKQS